VTVNAQLREIEAHLRLRTSPGARIGVAGRSSAAAALEIRSTPRPEYRTPHFNRRRALGVMNELRLFDADDRLLVAIEVGPLAIGVDGRICARPCRPSRFPMSARSCELLSNGQVVGEGPVGLLSNSSRAKVGSSPAAFSHLPIRARRTRFHGSRPGPSSSSRQALSLQSALVGCTRQYTGLFACE
jgi:hypothetical protein